MQRNSDSPVSALSLEDKIKNLQEEIISCLEKFRRDVTEHPKLQLFKSNAATREGEFAGYMLVGLKKAFKEMAGKTIVDALRKELKKWREHLKSVRAFDDSLINWLEAPIESALTEMKSKLSIVKKWKIDKELKKDITAMQIENQNEKDLWDKDVKYYSKDGVDYSKKTQREELVFALHEWTIKPDEKVYVERINKIAENNPKLGNTLRQRKFDKSEFFDTLLCEMLVECDKLEKEFAFTLVFW